MAIPRFAFVIMLAAMAAGTARSLQSPGSTSQLTQRSKYPTCTSLCQGSSTFLSSTRKARCGASSGTDSVTVFASHSEGGTASIADSSFNLAKCILGSGVLSLPGGVAFFTNSKIGVIPANLLTIVMGVLSTISFNNIGRACEESGASSMQEAWEKSVSTRTAFIIGLFVTFLCFSANLAYSIIIGDAITDLTRTLSIPAQLATRTNNILGVTALILLPLCNLKSLSSLAPFSLVGLAGTLYTAIFMSVRLLDGSYNAGGKFFAGLSISGQPSFGTTNSPIRALVLLSMLSTNYICHYNAPKFYTELKGASMKRFRLLSILGFGFSTLVTCFMMTVGFLTFGGNSLGLVLNNYAVTDSLATIARLAITVSLTAGYPLVFSALRDGVFNLMQVDHKHRDNLRLPLTFSLLGLLTGIAIVLKDVGFVCSLSGAMFGTTLIFIIPQLMVNSLMKKKAKVTGTALTSKQKVEILVNNGLIATGSLLGALGLGISVLKQAGRL